MSAREELKLKVQELKAKYADVINDLAIKYGVDVGVAYSMFLAIPRAMMLGQEPAYNTDLPVNYEELFEEYLDYLAICHKVL